MGGIACSVSFSYDQLIQKNWNMEGWCAILRISVTISDLAWCSKMWDWRMHIPCRRHCRKWLGSRRRYPRARGTRARPWTRRRWDRPSKSGSSNISLPRIAGLQWITILALGVLREFVSIQNKELILILNFFGYLAKKGVNSWLPVVGMNIVREDITV